jgi:hypothetical protein
MYGMVEEYSYQLPVTSYQLLFNFQWELESRINKNLIKFLLQNHEL